MSRIRVIGVGSPWGDDQIGWLAAEALKEFYDPQLVEVLTVDRPGPMLIEHMAGAKSVLLLDAVQGSGSSGRIHCLGGAELMCLARPQLLSHGMGVAEAVALAAVLGMLPKQVCLIGVELEKTQPGCSVSGGVQETLPAFVEAGRGKIDEWLGGSAEYYLDTAQ